jgi:hypothetical protein
MTLLTKPEAEQLVKQASSVARIPATTRRRRTFNPPLAENKNATVLLLKQ